MRFHSKTGIWQKHTHTQSVKENELHIFLIDFIEIAITFWFPLFEGVFLRKIS